LKKNMLLWSFCCSRISYWFSEIFISDVLVYLHIYNHFIDVSRTQTSVRLNSSLFRAAQAVEPYGIKYKREL
jgi:hypothetical protein